MTQADHEQVVEASWALGAYTTENTLTAAALQRIFQIIGADESVFNAIDLDTGASSAGAYPDVDRAPMLQAQLAEVLDDHPVLNHLAGTPRISPVRISDLLPFSQFERTRTYQTLFEPRALRHQLVIPVEVGGTRRAGMVHALNRCGRDFGQREVELSRPSTGAAPSGSSRSRADSGRRVRRSAYGTFRIPRLRAGRAT